MDLSWVIKRFLAKNRLAKETKETNLNLVVFEWKNNAIALLLHLLLSFVNDDLRFQSKASRAREESNWFFFS